MSTETGQQGPTAAAVDPLAKVQATEPGKPTAAIPGTTAGPQALGANLKAITIDKPVNGREMRDMLKGELLERAKAQAKALKIDDGLAATQFGLSLQQKIADFTGASLGKVTVKDSGLQGAFEEFDADVKGLKIDALPTKDVWYDFLADIPVIGPRWLAMRRFARANATLESRMVEFVEKFARAKGGQVETSVLMQALYGINIEHIVELQVGIATGEFTLEAMKAEYDRRAAELKDSADLMAHNELLRYFDTIIRFMARIQDMRKAWLAANTTGPMITNVERYALDQVSMIDNFITFALPEFRKRVLIGLCMYQGKQVAEMFKSGRKFGDDLMKGNMALMGELQTLVEENQRNGVFSVDVLKEAVTQLTGILEQRLTGVKTTMEQWKNDNAVMTESYDALIGGVKKVQDEARNFRFGDQKSNGAAPAKPAPAKSA